MRNCGNCTLCCTLCHVPELGKVESVACEHCDVGCRIYDARPPSCRSYECEWRKGNLPDWMRPDLSGVMVEEFPLMVAALLAPNMTLHHISAEVLDELDNYVKKGKMVVASGQNARLPAGMSGEEAKSILMNTVKEYRNGG